MGDQGALLVCVPGPREAYHREGRRCVALFVRLVVEDSGSWQRVQAIAAYDREGSKRCGSKDVSVEVVNGNRLVWNGIAIIYPFARRPGPTVLHDERATQECCSIEPHSSGPTESSQTPSVARSSNVPIMHKPVREPLTGGAIHIARSSVLAGSSLARWCHVR